MSGGSGFLAISISRPHFHLLEPVFNFYYSSLMQMNAAVTSSEVNGFGVDAMETLSCSLWLEKEIVFIPFAL